MWGICLFTTVLLVGCERYKLVDEINLVDVFGFDVVEDKENEIMTSGIIHLYRKGQEEEALVSVIGTGKSANAALSSANAKSSYPIEIGKARVMAFTERFTREQPIKDVVSSVCRDVLVGSNLKIIIINDNLTPFLEKLLKEEGDMLPKQIEHNMNTHIIPFSNLQIFLYNYYGEGSDPVLPYIVMSENGEITLEKVGVIGRQDKLKMVLGRDQSSLLSLIMDNRSSKKMIFNVPIHKEGKVGNLSFNIFTGKSKLIPKVEKNTFHVNLKIDGLIKDYPSWINLNQDKAFVEKVVKEYMVKNYTSLFKEFQKNDVDPLGVGMLFKTKDRKWTEKEFYKTTYPNIDTDLDVALNIYQSYLGDTEHD
ncbi:Ger(x)C family spore germination protein [Sutcliffiella halmapala]|uniref:Ger(x)C family spore germination protein n=1 Tax=Sutcliffiella halmapala TaxID=79882 RepID=UPI0014729129|nr:Ger(x)C family spore germination protein [Sutcliffiella halmapala]